MNEDSSFIPMSVCAQYKKFIDQCYDEGKGFRFTLHSELSPYALCFGIFGFHLLNDDDVIANNRNLWDRLLRKNIYNYRFRCGDRGLLHYNKAYMQLLTFTLSALSVLGTLAEDPLEDLIIELFPIDIKASLDNIGALDGVPRSGNLAMFLGIILLHARDWLNLDTQSEIDYWLKLHLENINQYGFWGKTNSMSHLQFQNGYHQYELFDYLGAKGISWGKASDSVAVLADHEGHFAPYPGGGGCYDYDAVFLLTAGGEDSIYQHNKLLKLTANSILSEQNDDGGFCESKYIRPRSIVNIKRILRHIYSIQGKARIERLRMGLTLLRPKHDQIHTHWSEYSRAWSESNMWDSWFRMLTLARIEVALEPSAIDRWGFINYPGIGYHAMATS